jgi:hypothetical protein
LRRDKKPAIEIAEAYTAWQKAAYDRAKKRLNGETEIVVADAKADWMQAEAKLAMEKWTAATAEKKEEAKMVLDAARKYLDVAQTAAEAARADAAAARGYTPAGWCLLTTLYCFNCSFISHAWVLVLLHRQHQGG